MSEFLAEARIRVVPDTTRFRAELEAQLAAATGKPVVIPVQAAIVSAGGTSATAGQAAKEQAEALRVQGAAATATAASTHKLTAAETAAAAASRKLTLAQEEVTTASSVLSAAQVTATRSVAATAAAQRALDIAISSGNAARIAAAREILALAQAQETEAITALNAARAQATHARTLGSVGTAAIASSASMLGLRGAVLTAGAAFLGATVAFQSISRSIKEASDRTEEFNKAQVVFGDSADQITAFAQTTASSLGIASTEALRATGIFGNLFRSIEIGQAPAAAMSEALVRLASDLASFNNADPSQVLDNLRSGLVGEPEPLRKFGIFLSQVRAQQEALIETGKKSVAQLTQADIVQARYNLILQDGAIAAGDFANTQGELANTTRTLKAEIQDLEGDIGAALIPTLTDTAGLLTDVAKGFKFAADRAQEFKDSLPGAGGDGGGRFGFLTQSLPASLREITASFEVLERQGTLTFGELPSTTLRRLNEEARASAAGVSTLSDALDAGARAARLSAFAIVSANRAINDIGQSLNALEVANLEIQTGLAPGGRAAEEANLRQQIEADKQAVEAAKSGTRARREALEDLKTDQEALARLQQEAAAEAEQNASDLKSAAQAALRAQQAADADFLNLLSQRRDDAERRAARASETEGLSDDIRAQDRIQALIQAQIRKIREQVKGEQARKNAIRELRIALIASRQEEDALRKERAAAASARKDEIQNLNIQIAEERGNKSAIERAIQTRIDTLNKQIKAAKGDQVKMKQLILERERLKNQLAELNKQQEEAAKEGKTFAQAAFEFAQSLQGFSANLLGNLIPGFATGGLVGGSQPTAKQVPADVGAGVRQQGVLQAAETRGVRPVQVDTTNALLRQILAALQGRHTTPPEARHNRAAMGAGMDTLGPDHGF